MKRMVSIFVAAVMLCTCMASMSVFANGTNETRIPQGYMVLINGTNASVSWRNPKADDITKISVYDVTDGTEKLVADTDNTAKGVGYTVNQINVENVSGEKVNTKLRTGNGASNYVTVTGLTKDKAYKYKLLLEYENGDTYAEEEIARAVNSSISNWTEYITGSYPHTGFRLTEDAYQGKAALYVHVNHAVNIIGSTYQRFEPKMTVDKLDAAKTYRFSYYYKSAGDKVAYQTYTGSNNTRKLHDQAAADWTYDYDERVPDGANKFMFFFEREHEGLYFDNIEVREVLADDAEIPAGGTTAPDGTKLGVNLLVNGNFENTADLGNADTEFATAVSTHGMTTVSWSALDTTKAKTVKIYSKNANTAYCNYVRAVDAAATSATFASDGADEYIIKTVSKSGMESSGITVECLRPDAAEYSAVKYTVDGAPATSLAAGNVTVSRTVINNKMGDNFEVMMLVAVYEGNLLKGYNFDCETLSQSGKRTAELSADINVDAVSENTVLKVYTWKNPTDFRSLYDVETLK